MNNVESTAGFEDNNRQRDSIIDKVDTMDTVMLEQEAGAQTGATGALRPVDY